jgi:hypothetical protein
MSSATLSRPAASGSGCRDKDCGAGTFSRLAALPEV